MRQTYEFNKDATTGKSVYDTLLQSANNIIVIILSFMNYFEKVFKNVRLLSS